MVSTLGISMPTYVVTSILIVTLGVGSGWVPTFGWHGVFSASAIIPVFSLALAPLAAVIRYFRISMLEVMHLDYVRTARAKGLRAGRHHRPSYGPQRTDPGDDRRRSLCLLRADRLVLR